MMTKIFLWAFLMLASVFSSLASAQLLSEDEFDISSQPEIPDRSSDLTINDAMFNNIQENIVNKSIVNDYKHINTFSITEFEFVDSSSDKVGIEGDGSPDGIPDAHFILSMHIPYPTEIKSIAFYYVKPPREISEYYHTSNSTWWLLGVFKNGQQINRKHLPSLGTFSGDVALDLYAGEAKWFESGSFVLADVETPGGIKFQKLTAIGQNGSLNNESSFVKIINDNGVVLRYLGNYQEAIQYYDTAIKLAPKNSIPWNNRGDTLYQLQDISKAILSFDRSLELDPQNALAWANKGIALSNLARTKEALYCFDQAIAIDVYNAEAWDGKGVALAKAGELDQALSCFNNAATLRKNYTEAWANGALTLKLMGLHEKSEEAYATARSMGYNKTPSTYLANTEPQLMEEAVKENPGFGSFLGILMLIIARRRKKTNA